jgi:hypothetical protein
MDRRLIFPVTMFVLAAVSFAYGAWQQLASRQVAAVADRRLAFIMTTVEKSRFSRQEKQDLYAAIFNRLPEGPTLFGIDLSGSFAAPTGGDHCTNDGQRTVCRALERTSTTSDVLTAVCGLCKPE